MAEQRVGASSSGLFAEFGALLDRFVVRPGEENRAAAGGSDTRGDSSNDTGDDAEKKQASEEPIAPVQPLFVPTALTDRIVGRNQLVAPPRPTQVQPLGAVRQEEIGSFLQQLFAGLGGLGGAK